MDLSRKLVIFPVDQFFAIIGVIHMIQDPYAHSIPDIFNHKSEQTHGARDHEHKPGRIFLHDVQFYSLADNRRQICTSLTQIHIPTKDIRAVVDFHPERFKGRDELRMEAEERIIEEERILVALHGHIISGDVHPWVVYRSSHEFVGMSTVTVDETDESHGLSLPAFFQAIGCPSPTYMAVHLGQTIHS